MKIELEVSEKNEGTESPWWFIVSPKFGTTSKIEHIVHCITGPFFSRESAEAKLNGRRYHYGKKAIVWCASGYDSFEYKQAIRNAKP